MVHIKIHYEACVELKTETKRKTIGKFFYAHLSYKLGKVSGPQSNIFEGFGSCESTLANLRCIYPNRSRITATCNGISKTPPKVYPKLHFFVIRPISCTQYEVYSPNLITRAERTNFQVKSLLIVGIDASD